MAANIQGHGAVLVERARDRAEMYAQAFSDDTFALSEVWGDPMDGEQISAAGVRWPMLLGRYSPGPRTTTEIIASDRRVIGTATAFTQTLPFEWFVAEWATYTGEVMHDLPIDAAGSLSGGAIAGARNFSAFQKRRLEKDTMWRMSIDLLGGDRTGGLAIVNAAVAAAATQFAARRFTGVVGTAGNRGALGLGRDMTITFNDAATGVRIGGQGYRITAVALGAAGAHDIVTVTPAFDVALPAGARVCEGDVNSNSFGKGFYSMREIVGDALDSPTLYGVSRVTNGALNAQVFRNAAALRRLTADLLGQVFQTLSARADVEPNYHYVMMTTPGLARDLWTAGPSVAAAVVIGAGAQPILDQIQYAPKARQLWGTGALGDLMVAEAPGGRVTLLTHNHFVPNTAFFVPREVMRKAVYRRPGWLEGPLTDGTGHRVDRRLQAVSAWWCTATQMIKNVPASARIDHAADFQIAAAQGGAGA